MPLVSLDLYEETMALLSALDAALVEHALAGGVALAVHGAPRATTDVDLLVRPEALEAALQVAAARGFTLRALPMKFSDGLEIQRVTKVAGDESLTLDFLLVNPNLHPVWTGRVRLTTEAGGIWVVSREGLIQMKAWAGREQDLADIKRLEELDR